MRRSRWPSVDASAGQVLMLAVAKWSASLHSGDIIDGIVDLIEHSIEIADKLCKELSKEENLCVLESQQTAITIFRPLNYTTEDFFKQLPEGMFSTCIIDNQLWLRSVAVNPLADIDKIISTVKKLLGKEAMLQSF